METGPGLEPIARYHQEFASYNQRRRALMRWYFKWWHRLEIGGADHVPAGPCLIAANHGGGFDLDIVALADCSLPGREVQVLIAQDWHFLNHWWGRYWVGGGIPLWTQGGIRWEYIDPYLTPGRERYPEPVAIYPEGHSGMFGQRRILHAFYPGVVRIALRYRIPIVPAAQVGFHRAAPIFHEIERDHGPNDVVCTPFTFPVKLKIEFGRPFELSEYYDRELSRPEEFWVANQVVRPRLAELLAQHGPVELEPVKAEMKKPGG